MELDDSHWPLVVQTFDGQQTDEDVEYFLKRREEICARARPFVVLTYIGDYALNLGHVARLGEALKGDVRARELCKGSAILAPSPSFRFVLSSFYLITKIPFPHIVCEDEATAETWLRQRLFEERLPLPDRLARASVRPSRIPKSG
jgi:hypothetical protein